MSKKQLDFGTCGPPGDQVRWKGILEDDTLGSGDTTRFSVELTRPTGQPAISNMAPPAA